MAGVGLITDFSAVARAEERIAKLSRFDRHQLLDTLGSEVEDQTRRRIKEEKESPEGIAWPDWSENYAKTRHGNHSLLEGEGDLVASLDYLVGSEQVEIGSNLVYFAGHDQGDERRGIPQRQVLGLSADNQVELDAVIDSFIDRLMES